MIQDLNNKILSMTLLLSQDQHTYELEMNLPENSTFRAFLINVSAVCVIACNLYWVMSYVNLFLVF